jgi:hypothetical protein
MPSCRAAGNQSAVLAHQRRRRPAPLLDACRDRGDLGIRVGPCIFGIRDQPVDRPALDLVGRPRPLISGRLSRAGPRACARARGDGGEVLGPTDAYVGRRLWSCVAPCRPRPVVPGWRGSSTGRPRRMAPERSFCRHQGRPANRPPGRLTSRSRKLYWARCAPEPIDFAGICATTTLFHCAPEPAAAALPGIKL